MSAHRRPAATRPAVLGVLGTLAVILPAFLTGAMAVQITDDLAMSASGIGLAIGSFFVGSTVGSTALGRLAERIGPAPAIRLGLTTTIAADLAIVALADGTRTLSALLLVAGLGNALTQPAINLLIVRAVEPSRLGLVMALKQSGMPGAALVGGLAVPSLALTVGWRAGYLLAAVLAAGSLALNRSIARPEAAGARPERRARPDLGRGLLGAMAAVGVLAGGAANIIVGYLVSGAVAAGIAPGPAGLLLTLGAALGIASRLAHGWAADGGRFDVLRRVVTLLAVGAAGTVLLAAHRPAAYLAATPIAFAAGWAWPGLFNLVVVDTNRSAPAAATGITQTGVYAGSLIGPVLAGVLIERWGYGAAWLLTAAALAGAAAIAGGVRAAMAVPGDGDRRGPPGGLADLPAT